MTKRDVKKLDVLLLMLTARFSDERINFAIIGRGDAQAIVALIREREKTMGAKVQERRT